MTGGIALPAHAKLNLDLRVIGRRPDGRHEVATRIQALALHDLLLVEPATATSLAGGFGTSDLVITAQRRLEGLTGRPLPARFRLVKRIPAGAGLGGGSSDGAATLRALARLYGLSIGPAELAAIAAEVGTDVPFFLRGGAADGRGAGERLAPAPLARGWFALAWPGFGISTVDVYAAWDRVGGDGANQLLQAAAAVEPRLGGFAARLGEGWLMTGSGSAFFRHCADRAEAELAAAGLDCWTAVTRPVPPWG